MEEIQSRLANATVYSVLDVYARFFQLPLDEASSKLCTIATPYGCYKFLRVPFVISSASEIFQNTMNEIFEGVENVEIMIDDILVWGRTRQEHDEH